MDIRALVGSTTFFAKVEKFLDDRRKGRPTGGSSIPDDLAELSQSSVASLSTTDPKALKNYTTYSTAFTYDQKARFVRDVGSVVETSETLQKLAKKIKA